MNKIIIKFSLGVALAASLLIATEPAQAQCGS